jgi:hypothetical protein
MYDWYPFIYQEEVRLRLFSLPYYQLAIANVLYQMGSGDYAGLVGSLTGGGGGSFHRFIHVIYIIYNIAIFIVLLIGIFTSVTRIFIFTFINIIIFIVILHIIIIVIIMSVVRGRYPGCVRMAIKWLENGITQSKHKKS